MPSIREERISSTMFQLTHIILIKLLIIWKSLKKRVKILINFGILISEKIKILFIILKTLLKLIKKSMENMSFKSLKNISANTLEVPKVLSLKMILKATLITQIKNWLHLFQHNWNSCLKILEKRWFKENKIKKITTQSFQDQAHN